MSDNKARYGYEVQPKIKLARVKFSNVPIAIFVGKHDKLSTVPDALWLKEEINDKDPVWPIVQMKEIDGGYETFFIGKDMSYFKDDVMTLVRKYNPIISY
jgi:hypothetical protein